MCMTVVLYVLEYNIIIFSFCLGLNLFCHILVLITFAQPFTLHLLGLEPVASKLLRWYGDILNNV